MRRLIDRLRSSYARSLAVAALLGVLLLSAQQAAFTHELGHLADDLAQLAQPGGKSEPAKACDQCLAFAPLAGAITAPTLAFFALSLAAIAATRPAAASVVATALPPRSRGPPTVL